MSSDDEQYIPDFSDLQEFLLLNINFENDHPFHIGYSLYTSRIRDIANHQSMLPLVREDPDKNLTIKSFYNKIFTMRSECLERGMTEESYDSIVDMLRLRETASVFEDHLIPKDCDSGSLDVDLIDLTEYAEIVMELNLNHKKGFEVHEEYLNDELEI